MSRTVLGWDIGGANIKAALMKRDALEPRVIERQFPVWREPGCLPKVLEETAAHLGGARTMGITMTAELADCFATKREGVSFVLDAFAAAFPDADAHVYGVDGGFRSIDAAKQAPEEVAAANWRASATLVARHFPDAIFLDVGSTTADLIPIVSGNVAAAGRTDPGRLQSGELVYTGVLRTPVAAIVRSVPVRGRRCRVAAEHFAIAADAHRWLGRIGDEGYTCDTPDGRGCSRSEAGARLARVVCADLEMLDAADITAIAQAVAGAQVRQVAAALRQLMRRLASSCPKTAVVAGQGDFIARAAAEARGLATRHLGTEIGAAAARAAPAAAVAYLLAEVRL